MSYLYNFHHLSINLMTFLCGKELNHRICNTMIAEDDADVPIVKAGVEKLKTRPNVIVIGTYTDFLILLVAVTPENQSIYFCKQTCGKRYYSIGKNKRNDKKKFILFGCIRNTVTGYDTTSCFFGMGKLKTKELLIPTNILKKINVYIYIK